ncbi:hypothetical protein OE165_27060, partial [Escherichia coli]|uniref:hypothetical protein n=1 Tax=Escherichia coli TaxID=562 RepID=UPI0021F32FA8
PELAVDEFSALLRAGDRDGEGNGENSNQIKFEEIVRIGLDASDSTFSKKTLEINPEYINQRIGINISADEMVEILERLDFSPTVVKRDGSE